jgi:DHA1 family inner membrane transport protein
MNHASLNLANALGAWLGGLVIAAGYGYRSTALVGVVLSVAGFLVVIASATVHVRGGSSSASRS